MRIDDITLGKCLFGTHRDIRTKTKLLIKDGTLRDVYVRPGRRRNDVMFEYTREQASILVETARGEERKARGRKLLEDFFGGAAAFTPPPAPVVEVVPEPQPAPVNGSGAGIVTIDQDKIECFRDADGEPFVSVPALCAPFNKDVEYQMKKLHAEGWACTRIIRVHDASGRVQEQWCIHADNAPFFVASFSVKGLTPEMAKKLSTYKKECAKVLASYFNRGVASNPRFSQEERQTAFDQDSDRIAKAMGAVLEKVTEMHAQTMESVLVIATKISERMDRFESAQPVVVGGHPITGPAVVVPQTPKDGKFFTMSELNKLHGFSPKCEIFREVASRLGFIGDVRFGRWNPLTDGSHGYFRDNWQFNDEAVDHMLQYVEFFKRRKNELTMEGRRRGVDARAIGETVARIQAPLGTGSDIRLARPRRQRRTNRFQEQGNVVNLNDRR